MSVDFGNDLVVETQPLYEYRDIWAEESSGTTSGSAEWSYGNGSTGFMGLPFDAGWELIQMAFQADTYPPTATIQVDLMNYNIPSNAAANTIARIELTSAIDGLGAANNAAKIQTFDPPILIPQPTIIGFITRNETGNISDARASARFRRLIGRYVSSVSLA